MANLARIHIYPIKSLDGIAVNRATVLKSGALQFDRQFAIFDERGKFVNGKRNAKVHLLRTSFDFDAWTVSLRVQGTEQTQVFHLTEERTELEAWLSDYFGQKVSLRQNPLSGFPDDTDACEPTIISTATLEALAARFPGISINQMRSRFRANLEIEDVPAFWEASCLQRKMLLLSLRLETCGLKGSIPVNAASFQLVTLSLVKPIPIFKKSL